jgi:hypothetical protein
MLELLAVFPWVVGAIRGVLKRAGVGSVGASSIAALDKAARAALDKTGVASLADIAIDPASVRAAAASFRSIGGILPDSVLRLYLAQTHLESSFGRGWGPDCWNMGAEQCTNGPGPDYTCRPHGDTHADGSKYTADYKCFATQQAAAAGYLRLLAADRYAAAYEAAQTGDVLGFVQGLFHGGHGGWFEGVGRTPEERWGRYLAGLLARLPAIDAALADEAPVLVAQDGTIVQRGDPVIGTTKDGRQVAGKLAGVGTESDQATVHIQDDDGGTVTTVALEDAAARVGGVGTAVAVGGLVLVAGGLGYGAWRLLEGGAPPPPPPRPTPRQGSAPRPSSGSSGGAPRPSSGSSGRAPAARGPAGGLPGRTPAGGPALPRPGGARRALPGAAPPPDAGTEDAIDRAKAQRTPEQLAADERAQREHDAADADALAEGLSDNDGALPPGFTPPPGTSADKGLETVGEASPVDDDADTAIAPGPGARIAGVGSGSMRGLLLEAVRNGSALNTDSFVEVDVPALDLTITVPRRAFRAHVNGYPDPLLLGVSYNDQIEICRLLGMISLTWEMVDAVWRASFTWPIEPLGQWVPGADIASLAFAERHTRAVDAAIAQLDGGRGAPVDAVIRPEGKAWILHENLPRSKGAVLWGWQRTDGMPLQGFGFRHNADHVDYSMCEPPALRQARILSTGQPIDLLDWYRSHFADPAMRPFLDAYEG